MRPSARAADCPTVRPSIQPFARPFVLCELIEQWSDVWSPLWQFYNIVRQSARASARPSVHPSVRSSARRMQTSSIQDAAQSEGSGVTRAGWSFTPNGGVWAMDQWKGGVVDGGRQRSAGLDAGGEPAGGGAVSGPSPVQ